MVEHELAFIDLENRHKKIEELNDEKNAVIARTGATIQEREDKIELKQKVNFFIYYLSAFFIILKDFILFTQLLEEIEKLRSDIERDNKKSKDLESQVKNVMLKHQEWNKKCSDLKAKAMQVTKLE